MKRLLLLGGNRYQIPVIKAAHQLGCYVITCDYLPNNDAHRFSDEYCNVSVIANLVMYLLMQFLMRFFVKLLKLPKQYLLPLVLLMCMVGAYTANNRIFDIWVLFAVGVIGYVLIHCGLNVTPMVLGFILGRIVESNFRTVSSQCNCLLERA